MRIVRACWLGVLAGVLLTAAVEAQRPSRRMALEWPAVDGEGLASLRLGFDEAYAPGLFGPPDSVAASPVAGRLLRYDVTPGVRLDVHVADGKIRALGLTTTGPEPPPRSPQTVRGVRLGTPVSLVIERYGEPPGGRLWYTDAGIAFNLESAADTVESILVFPPGTAPR
ncbi:MAG TPA: hypothetical protein VNK50_05890 [Calidithermus sp.]|nr:hypothetical protein [Calidithermus sp.]